MNDPIQVILIFWYVHEYTKKKQIYILTMKEIREEEEKTQKNRKKISM